MRIKYTSNFVEVTNEILRYNKLVNSGSEAIKNANLANKYQHNMTEKYMSLLSTDLQLC